MEADSDKMKDRVFDEDDDIKDWLNDLCKKLQDVCLGDGTSEYLCSKL